MNLPPMLPNVRISIHDRDDFVRNLVTLLDARGGVQPLTDGGMISSRLSPSAGGRDPVVTLDQIKAHCHIELDQTADDDELLLLEMAAHIHTENLLRRPGMLDSTAPENIKGAMLMLIAHWYRNREAVAEGSLGLIAIVPMAYESLIALEKDYTLSY